MEDVRRIVAILLHDHGITKQTSTQETATLGSLLPRADPTHQHQTHFNGTTQVRAPTRGRS